MSSVAPRSARSWLALALGVAVVVLPTYVTFAKAYERRWLDDDGFINLRIVRNLLDGFGPVFNITERVEAGTSPLWLGVVALLGALGVRLEDASVYMGIALTTLAVLLAQDAAMRLHAPAHETLSERLSLRWLPLGALVVAVLPPIWDYASAGLETGLSLFWLAAAYDVTVSELVAEGKPRRLLDSLARALWLGLGSLIRPELTLYALAFLGLLLLAQATSLPDRRSLVRRTLQLGLAFGALPFAYQIFRMGYYGALSPNTAITKEAFLVNWDQGRCYLRNFTETYKLSYPLLALFAPFWWLLLEENAQPRDRKRQLRLAALLVPPALGMLHAVYVVRMGGDYMHGRMFLPATFAMLLPFAVLPWSSMPSALGKLLFGGAGVVVLSWCWVCYSTLRVPEENQCGIGDERGWYARQAQVPNPVRLEEYAKHPFYVWGRGLESSIATHCPELHSATRVVDKPGCRLIHLLPEESREVHPVSLTHPLAASVEPRLLGMVAQGAIGISGFILPSDVHLADVHGLSDPWVSRVELLGRGRPGHEKTLPVAWRLARFSSRTPGEDASVSAARRALACGPLAQLERSVRAPLTPSLFFSNIAHAASNTRLRVPSDPFLAEARFCDGVHLTLFATAGQGGDAFHWRCPEALPLTVLRGAFDSVTNALAQVSASCSDPRAATSAASPPVVSPAFGPAANTPFELACPAQTRVVGIAGTADHVVHSLQLVCAAESGEKVRTHAIGAAVGPSFEFACGKGEIARSLHGRAGALLDAIGIGCSSTH